MKPFSEDVNSYRRKQVKLLEDAKQMTSDDIFPT